MNQTQPIQPIDNNIKQVQTSQISPIIPMKQPSEQTVSRNTVTIMTSDLARNKINEVKEVYDNIQKGIQVSNERRVQANQPQQIIQ